MTSGRLGHGRPSDVFATPSRLGLQGVEPGLQCSRIAPGLEVEVAEPDPVEGVDDQPGDVGDGLGVRPRPVRKTVAPAGELVLGLGRRALQAALGQEQRQPPVMRGARRQRRRLLVVAADPADDTGGPARPSRGRARPAASRPTNETRNPRS